MRSRFSRGNSSRMQLLALGLQLAELQSENTPTTLLSNGFLINQDFSGGSLEIEENESVEIQDIILTEKHIGRQVTVPHPNNYSVTACGVIESFGPGRVDVKFPGDPRTYDYRADAVAWDI